MKDFANIMSKNVYYINMRDEVAYQMRPLIYDDNFKPDEETTQAINWISFSGLFPTLLVKDSMFFLVVAIEKSIHFDMATINKTRPSCVFKVQMDLATKLLDYVEI